MNHEGTRKSTAKREHLHDIQVRPINRGERHQWDELIRQHHYLGLHSLIGESIRYIAVYQKQWLALLGWSAAALKCEVRDQWIGRPSFFQYQRLSFIANNSRFLILPHVPLPLMALPRISNNYPETGKPSTTTRSILPRPLSIPSTSRVPATRPRAGSFWDIPVDLQNAQIGIIPTTNPPSNKTSKTSA